METLYHSDKLMFRSFIDRLTHITEPDWSEFYSRMELADFKSHQNLLKAGEVERYLNFLLSGITRIYSSEGKKDYTISFHFPGNFFNAYASFLNRQRSRYTVEAITDIRLYRIHFDQLENLCQLSAAANAISDWVQEYFFMLKEKREHGLLSKTAEENYRELQNEQPQLIRQIPQKYLASYLGITPQSLSRIRHHTDFWKKFP